MNKEEEKEQIHEGKEKSSEEICSAVVILPELEGEDTELGILPHRP